MLVNNLHKIHPSDCPILAQIRKQYSGHRCHYNKGYIHYTVDGKAIAEHRLVAERVFGPITDDVIVHHKNERKTSNEARNLELMTRSGHAAHHHGNSSQVTCAACGQEFNRKASEVSGVNYCSKSCKAIAECRIEWPKADELAAMIDSVGNWSKLGRMLGVSDNAVRKRARRYGILN